MIGLGQEEGFGNALQVIEQRSLIQDDLNYSFGITGTMKVTIKVVVNSEGEIIECIDSTFAPNRAEILFMKRNKREDFYKSIKKDLRYSAVKGNDKSNAVLELSIIFRD